jgi:hypothetical protein
MLLVRIFSNIKIGNQNQHAKDLSDIALSMVISPRFITALALPVGIFGTFMGLYNKQQKCCYCSFLRDGPSST